MKKVAVLALLIAAFALGCGGPQLYKRVKSDPMPDGGTYDGVYFSQAYGRMELTANGSTVYGLYEAERWTGKIEGEVDGNVLNFKWTQYKQDLQGKEHASIGHGYFVYTIKDEGTPEKPRITHFIDGEWGYDQDNSGNPWNAVKFPEGTKKQLQAPGAAGNQEEGPSNPFGGGGGGGGGSAPSNDFGGGGGGGGLDNSGGGGMDDVDDLF